MPALLLPIKDLRNAKQRLTGVLTREERFGLAQAMLADTLRAVRGVRSAKKIFVVTNYEPALRIAEDNGWEILREDQQISESVSCASTKLYLVPKSHNSSALNPFTVRLARLDRNPESLNSFDSLLER